MLETFNVKKIISYEDDNEKRSFYLYDVEQPQKKYKKKIYIDSCKGEIKNFEKKFDNSSKKNIINQKGILYDLSSPMEKKTPEIKEGKGTLDSSILEEVKKINSRFNDVLSKNEIDIKRNEVIIDVERLLSLLKTGNVDFKSNDETVCFDDLGLPLHPLEVEVLNLVERAKRGEQVFPKYTRSVDGSVLEYLQKYYGKYLKCFGAEGDYIYQFHMQAIDSKFRQNLRIWLDRNNGNINNYVPNKSIKVNKEAQAIKNNPLDFIIKSNKINVLKVTKRI
jgi:hypothetical protein